MFQQNLCHTNKSSAILLNTRLPAIFCTLGGNNKAVFMFLLQHIDHYSRTKAIAEQMVIAANGGSLKGCEIDSCASSLNYMGKDTLRENCFLCLKKPKSNKNVCLKEWEKIDRGNSFHGDSVCNSIIQQWLCFKLGACQNSLISAAVTWHWCLKHRCKVYIWVYIMAHFLIQYCCFLHCDL